MSRPDLLALTPAALAALCNIGLVKRAQREMAAGQGPQLEEAGDGMVRGRFADGIVAELMPGRALRDCPCSCAATSVCRHRVAVALAYPAWHAGSALAAPPPAADDWTPALVGDPELLAFLGPRTLELARGLQSVGYDAEVCRGPGTAVAVRLPTCTIQFLVPRDLAYARCECQRAGGCEHVALAVWAARVAASQPGGAVLVHVGAVRPSSAASGPVLELAARVAHVVLEDGVLGAGEAIGAQLAHAQRELERAGMTWLVTLYEDLGMQLDAYRRRSSRYAPWQVAGILTELAARRRAAQGTGVLPPALVLGQGEARETPLDHVRLVSLGVRAGADGDARVAELFLAEPTSGVVLVLSKRWSDAVAGAALAERALAPGVRVAEAAHGQLVTRAAVRLANRAVRLRAARRGQVSVTPHGDAWAGLQAPLLVRDLAGHAALLRERPPRLLRPRVLASDVHVVAVAEVGAVLYAPGAQAVHALVRDPAGQPLRIVLRHRDAAPHALECLAAALRDPARPVRFVSGELRGVADGLELEPLALVSDRLIVPDLATSGAPLELPLGALVDADSAAPALRGARSVLEAGCHQGLARVGREWLARTQATALDLDSSGFPELAARLRALAAAPSSHAAEAWDAAAIWLALTEEAVTANGVEQFCPLSV